MYRNWFDSRSVVSICSATLYTNGVQTFLFLWPNMYQDQGHQHVVAGEGMISVAWSHTLSEAKEHLGLGPKTNFIFASIIILHYHLFIRQTSFTIIVSVISPLWPSSSIFWSSPLPWRTTHHHTKRSCCSHTGQRKVHRFIYRRGSITRQSNVVAIIVTTINIDLTRQYK